MGKGDQKTRRGKLFRGTYGARRPRKSKKTVKESSRAIRESPARKKAVQAEAERIKKGEPEGKAVEIGQETPGGGKEAVKE